MSKTLFPCIDNNKLSYQAGGRIVCGHCYSMGGVKVRRYRVKGIQRVSMTCIACGANEKHNNNTGEILSQTIPMMLVDLYKKSFMANHPNLIISL